MMGMKGKKKAIQIHINILIRRGVENDIYTPFNYNYTYNLKYMKICARHKIKYFTT